MESKKLEGSPIAYYVSGADQGEWALFLHAAFVDHDMFRTQVEHFQGRRNVLLIGCGEFDVPMELEALKRWKESEPDCAMVVLSGAGHCANMDVPQEFNETLERFWSGEGPLPS